MKHKMRLVIFSFLLSAVMAVPLTVPIPALAQDGSSMGEMRKKRYRYRKRKHRVQLGGFLKPWSKDDKDRNLSFNLDALYGYNAGYFELGPNAGISRMERKLNFHAGGWVEVNFIKNTRKKKFVPSLGIRVNHLTEEKRDHYLDVHIPYVSLKYFPASRTGLVLNIGYNLATKYKSFFRNMRHEVFASLNYVHYFHQ